MILDFDTFHILTADIEDTVYLRIKESGCIIVRYGLNLALIQHQSGFDQCFTVTGGTGVSDPGSIRHLRIDFLYGTDRGCQRISVVVVIERIQQGTILADQSGFCCGGTCIDTEETVAFVGSQITGRYIVLALSLIKGIVIFLRSEQRFHTCNLEVQFDGLCHTLFHGCQGYRNILFCIQCRTDGCKQMGVFRYDRVLLIQFQGTDKCLF